MDIEKLEKILVNNQQPKFRLAQIKKAIFQEGKTSFSEISNIPKALRIILEKEVGILLFQVVKVLVSIDGQSIKALLKMEDGKLVETVLLSPKPRIWSVCLSSQIGCPMGCQFCATGKMGFVRDLKAEEIFDQVLFWRQYLAKNKVKGKLTNIIYMGMGEPFLNWKNVKQSLLVLINKKYFDFRTRAISISTVGFPTGIEKIASEFPQINLALSLHFTQDKLRNELMPINQTFNLAKLKDSLEKYIEKCNRKVFLEYVMFQGLNDSEKDAQNLVKYVQSFQKTYLIHINLIRYNETSTKFKATSYEQMQKFKDYLIQNRIKVTIRKSLGTDIKGACGQLAGIINIKN